VLSGRPARYRSVTAGDESRAPCRVGARPQTGLRFDDRENEIDGRCIGAPIQTGDGRVIAAVSISGPVFRLDMNLAKSLAPALRAACVETGECVRRG
jgi:DNA-binding IclR family transcriptional regulator